MSERDELVEALAAAIYSEDHVWLHNSASFDIARTILASDWLRELLAEAWDEGWDEGSDDTFGKGRSWNPYRQEAR